MCRAECAAVARFRGGDAIDDGNRSFENTDDIEERDALDWARENISTSGSARGGKKTSRFQRVDHLPQVLLRDGLSLGYVA